MTNVEAESGKLPRIGDRKERKKEAYFLGGGWKEGPVVGNVRKPYCVQGPSRHRFQKKKFTYPL